VPADAEKRHRRRTAPAQRADSRARAAGQARAAACRTGCKASASVQRLCQSLTVTFPRDEYAS